MKPGYSKLLVHEMIEPGQRIDTFTAIFDLVMMSCNAGAERTETQWRGLLDKCGFEVIRVWPAPEVGVDGVVEAMLKA